MSTKLLFLFTFVTISSTYAYFLGLDKSLELIKNEYLILIFIIILSIPLVFFKIKLRKYKILNYFNNNQLSFKSTVIFFLIFQIIDYISEDGFIGMISQWLIYWLMGLIAVVIIENLNLYKNYKVIYKS